MTKAISEVLNQVHSVLLQKNYSTSTIQCYSDWIYRFFFFKNIKSCEQIEKRDINDFLTFIKNNKTMAESSKKIAASALKFLCKEILKMPFKNTILLYSPCNKQKPLVLKKEEIKRLLSTLSGEKWLILCMMYGCGLSCNECLSLRVKDINFDTKRIKIYDENHPRFTLFPETLYNPIINQINKVEISFHENISIDKYAGVFKPNGLYDNKYLTSNEFKEHFLFPSKKLRHHSRSGKLVQYSISESLVHKTLKKALRLAGISKKICCTTFRHSFATHLIEDGYDIHLIQKLMGHKNIQSTLIYKDIAKQDAICLRSPLDNLFEPLKNN
uniref:tyrosine-type recombinase/integrase n=1 Tax=uncultured Draconibacterium sp. TaxID=1573823 RepID=UPI0032177483